MRLLSLVNLIGLLVMFFMVDHQAVGADQEIDPGPREVFNFALIGETPFGATDVSHFAATLRDIDASDSRFAIHTGDLKSPTEKCSDDLLEERKALFDGSLKPVIFLPGENDWTNCDTTHLPDGDALERLARLREVFFSDGFSLGQDRLPLARQSDMVKFRRYSENVRWTVGSVLFVGLNMPGNNNDFHIAAGRNGEFEERSIANLFWLDRAFRFAQMHNLNGIVIALQADLDFEKPIRMPDHRSSKRDGYYEFKFALRDLVSRYRGQVLLIHGGATNFVNDHPLKDAAGQPLRNFTRVTCMGPANPDWWVRINVDPTSTRLFDAMTIRTPSTEEAGILLRTLQ